MNQTNMAIAEAYYTAMGAKDSVVVGQYLRDDVQLIAPLRNLAGKQEVLEGIKGFMAFFKTLIIRAQFGNEQQAVVVYDVDFPAPVGFMPGVALLTLEKGLIVRIELFYDIRPLLDY